MDSEIRDKHHFHSCITCGYIWDHEPMTGITKDQFDEAHTCSNCRSAKDCDIACATRAEAEEFAVHEVITIDGKQYHAPQDDYLADLVKIFER